VKAALPEYRLFFLASLPGPVGGVLGGVLGGASGVEVPPYLS